MMREIQKLIFVLALIGLLPALSSTASGQPQGPVQAVKQITATRESMAMSYPEGVTISIKFQGTHRLPTASGEAKIQRKKGMTEIEIEIDEMKPASYFGGDYNTYVLWIVSPEGHVDNVGEFILEGNRSKLNVSTPLETFGMFITAEPHFLVGSPSRFVVMENTRPAREIGNPIQTSQIKYAGFDGIYHFERESLANLPEIKGEVRADVGQARTSVELAERAGAPAFAAEELAQAREAQQKTEAAAAAGISQRVVMVQAHETVRLAVDAQKLAEQRAFQAALDAERKAKAEEIAKLEKGIEAAQTEAERARLIAEQRELQLRIEERARQEALRQAEDAARRAAEEERRRQAAEAAAERARLEAEDAARRAAEEARRRRESEQQAQQLALAKTEAEMAAERARQEREEARARMQQALGLVAETRETARGIIVNLPDILFDFNRATLRPQAREVLSKIAGIMLVARGYQLKVEGHTDNIGSDDYNQKLSEKRAQAVRDYLASSGLSADIITAQGFGESQPIASNTKPAGRQKNRRVEIVIEDAGEIKQR
jgi:outer membrane protein OmpA-like peptidoglycan-associated protein